MERASDLTARVERSCPPNRAASRETSAQSSSVSLHPTFLARPANPEDIIARIPIAGCSRLLLLGGERARTAAGPAEVPAPAPSIVNARARRRARGAPEIPDLDVPRVSPAPEAPSAPEPTPETAPVEAAPVAPTAPAVEVPAPPAPL